MYFRIWLSTILCATVLGPLPWHAAAASDEANSTSFAASIDRVQPNMVKIHGAGGLRGFEAYQSGFLISADGHVLTVWSYVLDTEYLTVTLNGGRKFDAVVVGADPRLEIAVLKLKELPAADLPHFDLPSAATRGVGTRILAFSNLYGVATGDEPSSVQRGIVSATTNLTARKGVFKTQYRGQVYVTDAMTNNPGSAGGALTTLHGELLGMLGKELRNSLDNTWLNYAIPISELRTSVEAIIAGKSRPLRMDLEITARNPVELAALGLILVPDVVDRTPPFIDSIRPDSPAEVAGLLQDDLILFINNVLVQSLDDIQSECKQIERGPLLSVTIRRGDELRVIELATMPVAEAAK